MLQPSSPTLQAPEERGRQEDASGVEASKPLREEDRWCGERVVLKVNEDLCGNRKHRAENAFAVEQKAPRGERVCFHSVSATLPNAHRDPSAGSHLHLRVSPRFPPHLPESKPPFSLVLCPSTCCDRMLCPDVRLPCAPSCLLSSLPTRSPLRAPAPIPLLSSVAPTPTHPLHPLLPDPLTRLPNPTTGSPPPLISSSATPQADVNL